jgi:hypothetical protein
LLVNLEYFLNIYYIVSNVQAFDSKEQYQSNREKVSLLRKEVIHPHVPVRIPCYDFTPIANHTLGTSLLTVRPATSGATNSRGVTGGVYKTRERIHRNILICDY